MKENLKMKFINYYSLISIKNYKCLSSSASKFSENYNLIKKQRK